MAKNKYPKNVVESPEIPEHYQARSIFLAGSIESGSAENWQEKLINSFNEVKYYWLQIFNPRRKEWNSDWKQELNSKKFYEQVNWELDMLERATVIAMYFDPNTKSPISLLELGLYASSGKLVVYCPEGFWRKGNVDIVCQRYNIPVFTSEETWRYEIDRKLGYK